MKQTIEIKILSEPKFLKIVRAAVSHVTEIMGFPQDEINNITLAVDEACSNIIKHAYGGQSDQPIRVLLQLYDDRLEVILKDVGKKVAADDIKSRDLDDLRPGGLGVHLIRSVMDVVNYNIRSTKGNRLQLVKFLRRKGS
ncbi:MAG: ATP-binding protein [candidate division KSB1 bacterium]|nr:ATP-binding protein [candidate division KSB1 bacterium]MDZ7317974.1 ATP-binding protein [candidate division KSB1 bacterium]MDZ7341061.1 ATP-binding protein [candidate division KSB1 bacterium]